MSIMSEPPFNTATDQNIAIAYVSAFIFIFFLTLFPLGGNRMIAWDFVGPKVEDEERREMVRLKRQAIFRSWRTIASTFSSFVKGYRRNGESTVKEHSSGEDLSVEHEKSFQAKYDRESIPPEAPSCLSSRTLNMILNASLADVATILPREPEGVRSAEDLITVSTRVISPAPSLTQAETVTQVEQRGGIAKEVRFDELSPPPCRTMTRRLLLNFRTFALGLLSPASLSVILAFPIDLITPLKGLLVSLPNSPIPNAPDGQPPLAFIMDTATFVGAASVPLGLICLGSALARLKVPMNAWNTMPLGSILSLAVGKIVLMPVLGVLICQGLTNVGVIDKDDKVLRFVCIREERLDEMRNV
ncbi:hypothetical protein PHLCEN_2v5612 [Hermanssonia centrifuga]|uniref:PIN-like protein n=1 Tax=Hermanssonia centrifuga TaxID=98765 RepID=A0A2R6P2E9_9APHY|nr:hypothetical protein PHLCEN_2v5612 [Hermanssonia centrifuga]